MCMQEEHEDWNYIRNCMILVGCIAGIYYYEPLITFKETVHRLVSAGITGIFLGFILALAALPIRRVWYDRHTISNLAFELCKALGLSILLLIGIILCLLYLSWDVPL